MVEQNPELILHQNTQLELRNLLRQQTNLPVDAWTAKLAEVFYAHANIEEHFTTPTLLFPQIGACYANNAIENVWNHSSSFDVYEIGGGKGYMARSFLEQAKSTPDFFDSLQYHIIEFSDKLIREQKKTVSDPSLRDKIEWIHTDATTYDFPAIQNGMVILFEIDDALPTKAFVKIDQHTALELFLSLKNDEIVELLDSPEQPIRDAISKYPEWFANVPQGDDNLMPFSEGSLRIRDKLGAALKHGSVITADYGFHPDTYPFHYPYFSPIYMMYKNDHILQGNAKIADMFNWAGVADTTASVDLDLIAQPLQKNGFMTKSVKFGDWLSENGKDQIVKDHISHLSRTGGDIDTYEKDIAYLPVHGTVLIQYR
jgi:SAM-dependent MidA family methyltransferase